MRLPIIASLMFFAVTIQAQEGTPPTFEQQAQALEAEIEQTGKIDGKWGRHLGARLDYAQLLARHVGAAECATLLPRAEAHFKVVKDSVVAPLVLTAARGRIPVVGYYLAAARARCASDAAVRTTSLNEALNLAREAVSGYRAAFMYEPMVIMQFNVAETLKELGDLPRAIEALQAAIELDREFGFRADAEENYRTLHLWQGKTLDDAQVEAYLAPFAPRSVSLNFGWKPTRVEAEATFDNATFEGDAVRHTRFSLPMTGAIREAGDTLLYDVTVGETRIDASTLGSDIEKKVLGLITRIVSRLPVAEISKSGEFKAARDIEGFAEKMNAELDKAVAAAVPEGDPRHAAIKAALDAELRPIATADNLLARFQQGYALETGIWVGATLQQNSWMQLPLTLAMHGTPQGYIEHSVEVVFSRHLPCAAGRPADSCVELLIEALPTSEAVDGVVTRLQEAGQGRLDYASATRLRLVVDPATLIPYENETLRYSYLALASKSQREVKISSDQSRITYRYRK